MNTFLKNYTSGVPVSQTIYRIEQTLIKCQVKDISKEYSSTGRVLALRFSIQQKSVEGVELPSVQIRLPVDVEMCQQALWLDYAAGEKLDEKGTRIRWNRRKQKSKADFLDQAERTAWKIMQDWVEVQLSMIQLKQADTLEVFLPYVWDGKTTFYKHIKDRGYRGLLPETVEAEIDSSPNSV